MHVNFPSSASIELPNNFGLLILEQPLTHMTSDLAQLNLATPFSGSYTIAMTDGSRLSISNVGSFILDVPQLIQITTSSACA
jgi:hypothetical protein